jgi:hypothetical protein
MGLKYRCLGAALTVRMAGYAFQILRSSCNNDGLGEIFCDAYVL